MPRSKAEISKLQSYILDLESYVNAELFSDALNISERLDLALKTLTESDFVTYRAELTEILNTHKSIMSKVEGIRKEALVGLSSNMKAQKAANKYRKVNDDK